MTDHIERDGMTGPAKYRKRPVVIEAVQFTGDNVAEIAEFTAGGFETVDPFERSDSPEIVAEVWDYLHETWVGVKAGQWIIRGVKGEFYPHDADLFAESYERVTEGEASE